MTTRFGSRSEMSGVGQLVPALGKCCQFTLATVPCVLLFSYRWLLREQYRTSFSMLSKLKYLFTLKLNIKYVWNILVENSQRMAGKFIANMYPVVHCVG